MKKRKGKIRASSGTYCNWVIVLFVVHDFFFPFQWAYNYYRHFCDVKQKLDVEENSK